MCPIFSCLLFFTRWREIFSWNYRKNNGRYKSIKYRKGSFINDVQFLGGRGSNYVIFTEKIFTEGGGGLKI